VGCKLQVRGEGGEGGEGFGLEGSGRRRDRGGETVSLWGNGVCTHHCGDHLLLDTAHLPVGTWKASDALSAQNSDGVRNKNKITSFPSPSFTWP
jgi:hypothetical protein